MAKLHHWIETSGETRCRNCGARASGGSTSCSAASPEEVARLRKEVERLTKENLNLRAEAKRKAD